MNTIPVDQTDQFGFFQFRTAANELALAPGFFNIPYRAYADLAPEAPAGMIQRRVGAAWEVVEDHRADTLYYVKTPATETKPAVLDVYQFGTAVDVDGTPASYDGGGPVPDWLTDVAPVPEPAPEPEQLP
ncbi:hypothetical protein [Herminiimonas arsenitoxidans]|uniref:hypothetical protein n=1 Tax=Herminiimonas arsenitoxidans TaxID=1809410 RepID=UPI000970C18A|nr:hypothetical protein [Herminiimonas arsenitoxidans]